MLRPGAPGIASVDWEYARWKPGVSVTCTYEVGFEDGSREVVVAKRYADGKDRILSSRPLKGQHWKETSPRLIPRVALREEATLLFTHVADRELKGMPYFLERKKTAKILRETGLAAAGLVRRRRLEYELLRYKPERRAVYRLQVKLRDEARTRFQVGCRIFRPPKPSASPGCGRPSTRRPMPRGPLRWPGPTPATGPPGALAGRGELRAGHL